MGRYERRKGYRGERIVVEMFKHAGLEAKRVPLSGATEFAKGDVVVKIGDKELVLEVKWRGRGFNMIYKYLAGKDALVIKRDRAEPVICMPLSLFLELVGGDKGGNNQAVHRDVSPPGAAG